MPDEDDERYVVISADCHGGGDIPDYRPYLPSNLHDEFDAWMADYENPYDDLRDGEADRNWNSDLRLREMEADGIVGEVVFPNTVPPFFPKPSLVVQPPGQGGGDISQRWAGLQAHNRWLVDFCAATPGRRAGICQIMLHDVDAAVAEVRWAHAQGLTGGVLLPGAPPGSGVPPLYAPDYEPLWSVCEELDMPLNHHNGSAAPDFGEYPAAEVMFLLEVSWWAHRTLGHLIFSGVLERHPDLQVVFTEQGTAWVVEETTRLDYYHGRLSGSGGAAGSREALFGEDVVGSLQLKPSEYWARQCHVGSSFIRAAEVPARTAVGVDRVMWGSDYPHLEGCWPFSTKHLRLAFADVPEDEVRQMVGLNAAELYGFDLDLLAPIAREIGPSPSEVAVPLPPEEIPDEAMRCPAFAVERMKAAAA